MAKTFTRAEVKAHNTPQDLWIIYQNKVYDVSAYREEHPGGAELLIEVGGTDSTQAFDDVGHSDDARELLEPLLIGALSAEDTQEVVEAYRPTYEVVATKSDLRSANAKTPHLRNTAYVSLLAIGLGTLAYSGKLPKQLPQFSLGRLSLDQVKALLPSGMPTSSGGFWKGFVVASVVQIAATVGGIHHLEKLFDIQIDFRRFPSHRTASVKPHSPPKPLAEPVLHQQQWRKFPLIRRDTLSPNVYRLIFALPKSTDVLGLPTGQHVAIRAEVNGKMISRSYTPTSNNTDLGRIELVIKVYPNGLITNYLASLKLGDLVEFRGPKGAMKYHRDLCKNLGMIAGGTGITPMYQLIRAICEDPKDTTKISLLYANQTEADILLREELDEFARKFPQKFSVWYVLNTAPPNWKYGQGFITKDAMKAKLAAPSPDTKVHLCGPPPMINAMKGALAELGFTAPSSISKATDQVFLF
ncbi:hypothetical protein BP5796_02706 [Coleophoma crateriformis]|uniref:NADH-cytochrome b5 reductase 1 n=1 Tax=Coleophoma crateriformis TaxID=565419 RepID=A0A3D8SZE9_9HELO|nr:hypothetical protein BP5796_02706 [Coleophoma crateriformis]